ncbi:hypothetical protein OPV22_019762 [Ensete ventricosum]|uniref:Uncharacterized protein n=1 Tax=Ensete ventricosum TaxID=4639 RepID=A0AAV8QLI9_ENSVE|nr:hypothetical protein OPV22_019762 [Ensete ventricosum]
MMQSRCSQPSDDYLLIKQDDKFHSRLLSRENSSVNPSLRVYYGVAAGAVPFQWESEPGTPKNIVSDGNLPPLSPPPSYFSSPRNREPKKSPKPTLFRAAVLPKLILRKLRRPSSSSMTLISPSESPISTSSPKASPAGDASPTSFFCFMARQGAPCGLKGAATR